MALTDNELILHELMQIKKLTVLRAKNVLDVKEVALLLGKAPKTIYNQMSSIPHYTDGNKVLFKRDEIEAWMLEGMRSVTPVTL